MTGSVVVGAPQGFPGPGDDYYGQIVLPDSEFRQELIDSTEVDALIVASPDPTHAPLALAAIAAGKHILNEKPLGISAAESLSVVEEEVAVGRRLLTVGFMRRFDPGYTALQQMIHSGDLVTTRRRPPRASS